MSDFQRVVEFLRDFRTSPIQTVTDEVRSAATEYAELCASANERLRHCAVLLQRGLRAEAINLAEASPNLLDLVTALDLPAADRWAEFCQREDLPVPPQLQIERAALLNDAYGQEQPLEELYARHRRLALSQAAVQKRLAVMRQIAQMDPSPFWDKDIRVFEYARFKEMRLNLATAIRDKDMKAITALSQEVLESPWLEAVPADLQSASRDVNDRMRQNEFDAATREIAEKLRSAFAAKSLGQCSELLEKVNELMAAYGTSNLPAEAAAIIDSARKWVKQENESRAAAAVFASACDALHAGLDADAPSSELEGLSRAALSHGRPLPEDLRQRYELTLKRRAAAKRNRLLLGLAAVVAFLAAGALVGFWVLQAKIESQWALKIHTAAAHRDLALARKLVEDQERMAPKVGAARDVAAAKREVDVLQQQADTDSATLRAALASLMEAAKKADAARQAEDAAGADPASTASLDGLHDAATAVSEALGRRSQLPDLSWVDPNKSLAMATRDLQAWRADLLDRYARGVLARVRAASDRADQLNADAGGTTSETMASSLEHDLSGLRSYITTGSEAASAADAVGKKIADYREGVRKHKDFADARSALAASLTDAAAAQAAMTDFAARFPSASLSKDLVKAAASVDMYKAVEAWHVLSGPWLADPAPANEKAAQQRLELVRAYLHDYPASADAPRASAYADYLQQAAEAMAVQNTWQTSMNDVLTSPLIADLKFVQTTDGVKYYVMGDLNARKRQFNEQIIYTFDTLDPQNLTHKRQVTLSPSVRLTSDVPQPTPHAQFVQSLVEELKTVDKTNWDTFGIDLVGQIAEAKQIDPVVKAILLRDAVTATDKALAWASIDVYQKPAGDLVRQRLDQVVWYDPDHPVAAALLVNLGRIFQEVPKAADARKLLESRKAELFKTLRPRFGGYGLLLHDDSGGWTVQSRSAPQPGATAVAIVPPAPAAGAAAPGATLPATVPADPATTVPTNPAKFVQIAEWKNGTWAVDEAAIHDLPQGTLLLITRP